jgi:hypothetical protein
MGAAAVAWMVLRRAAAQRERAYIDARQ